MPSVNEVMDDSTETETTRRQLQLLAGISDPAIAYLDAGRRFEITNEAFKRRFGQPDRDANAGDFFDGVCSPAVGEYLTNAIERRQTLSVQLDCTGENDDTDRLRLRAMPCFTQNEVRGIFVVFEEIESRTAEPKSKADGEEDDRMAHLQRMAKLGEMAAGLAHEVRQPLAAIGNYANALTRLLRTARHDEALVSLVEQITDQAERADHIVATARNMIGQGKDRVRSFDLVRVVEESIALAERRARQLDVDVRFSAPSNRPSVRGNSAQIEQILVNLMTNALDAMADCGRRVLQIDIETTHAHAVRVRVRDSGDGIPQENLSSIFNAFDTSKRDGMGMGLSISRALAERHGGQLWAETDVEAGASFVLELPVCNEPADKTE
ncbi:ATP-binding protein [Salinisphaera sp.]|uniref:ATP-binding protein n=1 Tax=Salinisphaera sp. TaxID=1914330 RepID=UPI002D7709CC|nr:ATP-binding protein [Salinisphaera sp.]HET7313995.1 ATP-binding protein [Salinisphaera sp.]